MSAVRFAMLCDKCQRRSEEYTSWPTCKDCGGDICPNCDVSSERTEDERNRTLCKGCAAIEDAGPECECVRIDVDLDDNRYCPAHGPNSEGAKEERAQEAADEAAYWSHPGWAEVFKEAPNGERS